jgi:phospholipase/carboxylesterase
MTDPVIDRLQNHVVALLRVLETLQLIARHLSPAELAGMLDTVGAPDEQLRTARLAEPWPEPYPALGAQLDAASDEALAAFDGLRSHATDPGAVRELFRAMRHLPRALEALYPLTGILPPVNRFFLDAERRKDGEFQKRFLKPPTGETGLVRFGEDPDARETVWAYIPETYAAGTPHPVVVCLHGGSGRGRAFIWSWVREARSRGAIVIAPTSLGPTWAIQGEDVDSPHVAGVLDFVGQTWSIDRERVLLTGMSDGGTFSYVSGLQKESPFTHLAPVAAAFHPLLTMTAAERLRGLPIHIIHGTQDWMFPVQMAREAEHYLTKFGAAVTYREIPDLSHTYGTDLSAMILDWLLA